MAPAMGLFLLVVVLSPRHEPMGYLPANSTNDLLATLASHHGYAYVAAAFHSKQNGLDDGLEWTTKTRTTFRTGGGFSLLRTNSLMQ